MKHSIDRKFSLCCLLLVGTLAWAQAPTGLAVKSATSKQIVLSWSGTAASYTVQRAPLGGGFSTIATATTATYTDTTIDAFTTYQYQILNGASASAKVTVGPPPSGITNAAPAPLVGNIPSTTYGYDLSLTLDGNGDPAFLFIWEDPANTSDETANQLLFRSWNRAQYAWNPVVKLGIVGDVASTDRSSTALAYDSSTATFVAASETAAPANSEFGSSIQVFVSADGGATWSLKTNLNANRTPTAYGPSVALAGGNIYVAYDVDTEGLKYVSGKLSAAPATWVTRPDPFGTNNLTIYGIGPSIAVDSNGNPAIAFFVENPNGPGEYDPTLYYWRPANTGSPVKVLDSRGFGQDDVAVKLLFNNLNPRVLVYIDRGDGPAGEEEAAGVHFAHSEDGGLTWKAPSVVGPDGNASTDYPFDMALDSKGDVAVAFGQNGSTGDDSHHCPYGPKLAFSSDLTNFAVCPTSNAAVAALTAANASQYGPYPAGLQIAYGGNDRLYLLWLEAGETQANTGILMYREPPASAVTGPTITSVSDNNITRGSIVAGSWVSIFGANLAGTTRTWGANDFSNGNALPTSLDGVSVKVNGIAAAVYYISPTQIDIQAPAPLSSSVSVQVTYNGASSAAFPINAVTNAPTLFSYTVGGTTFPAALFANSTVIVGDPALAGNIVAKAHVGDYIALYVNGVSSSPAGNIVNSAIPYSGALTATVGGATAVVQFAGLVAAGEFQVNIMVPSLPPGLYPVVVTAAGQASQSGVMIPVQ